MDERGQGSITRNEGVPGSSPGVGSFDLQGIFRIGGWNRSPRYEHRANTRSEFASRASAGSTGYPLRCRRIRLPPSRQIWAAAPTSCIARLGSAGLEWDGRAKDTSATWRTHVIPVVLTWLMG